MNIREKIFGELEAFCEDYFKSRDYFALVYGSYASNDFTDKSDLDFYVAVDKQSKEDFENLRNFIVNLHNRNNLKINEEVPYENKLVVSYEDAMQAMNLKAFIESDSKYTIPPITEEAEFLASIEVRYRIILNSLTSPNEFICGNKEKYLFFKKEAEKAIIKLVRGLSEKSTLTEEEILGILLRGKNGEESGDYLGYRTHRPKVVNYLKEFICRNI